MEHGQWESVVIQSQEAQTASQAKSLCFAIIPTWEVCPDLCLQKGPHCGTQGQWRGLTGTPSSEI